MAGSTDAPYGFRLVKRMGGGECMRQKYPVDASNSTAIFRGDVIRIDMDGNVAPAAAGDAQDVIGVCIACYTGANDGPQGNAIPDEYLAASTAGYIDVCIDPMAIYQVQTDGAISNTVASPNRTGSACKFDYADHIADAGLTATGLSQHSLDGTMTDATAQFKLIDKVDYPNNNWTDTYVEVFVMFNEGQHVQTGTFVTRDT